MMHGDYSSLDKPMHCERHDHNHRSLDRLDNRRQQTIQDEDHHSSNYLQVKKPFIDRNRSVSNGRNQAHHTIDNSILSINHADNSEYGVNHDDIEHLKHGKLQLL